MTHTDLSWQQLGAAKPVFKATLEFKSNVKIKNFIYLPFYTQNEPNL